MKALVRELRASDLPAAKEIHRAAFTAFLKTGERVEDRNFVESRFRCFPQGALAGEVSGALVGASFLAHWGSLAVLGPTVVKPTGWTGNAGRLMLEEAVERARALGCRYLSGFTFSNSSRHIELFQKLGFWPRLLTTVFARPIKPPTSPTPATLFSAVAEPERAGLLTRVAVLTGSWLEGLRLDVEIQALAREGMGETVVLFEEDRVVGLAVCHLGAGSEALAQGCYIKFGGVASGPGAAERFDRLLAAVETVASARGCNRLTLGMNAARRPAYQHLMGQGFVAVEVGVAMHYGDDPLYSAPQHWVIDDWR